MSSRKRLVEVALKEFLVNGYQKTSLSNIANKLGITKPALYYYFSSKKELFLECVEEYLSYSESISKSYVSRSTNTKDKMKELIIHFSDPVIKIKPEWELEDFNDYYFVFDAIKNVPESKELFSNASSGMIYHLGLIVQEGIEKSDLKPDTNVEMLLYGIGFLVEGFALGRYMEFLDKDSSIIDNMIELIWNGLK